MTNKARKREATEHGVREHRRLGFSIFRLEILRPESAAEREKENTWGERARSRAVGAV